ncbi:WD40/YVTN/BNR-like repeat-containing protein [Rubrivirga litoralis]|uniref:Glycosyl hydrolase n=1 Tax=Rubrivirga litoralis TaxID=3075598 RepID=A0ABU3BMF5_9BACT|nr:glycosyl hydrolase [Rubrivirga sp. F394]MDT0630445.1 glycosyl hydrolase [Rubrivirga sp. F394]
MPFSLSTGRPLALALAALVVAAPPVAAQNTDPVRLAPAGVPGVNAVAPTPAAERERAAAVRADLARRSAVAEVPFRSVGPTVMSGRVTDVEGKPGDPSDFYVAYASGGLWRTQNAGGSFEPLFDDMPQITIGDIAVDWRDPEGDGPTVWVGTGESNSSRSSYAGSGLYKSTDGGRTWAHLGLDETHHVGRVVVHPADPDVALVAAVGHLYSPNPERGLYRTEDGGTTWTHVLALDDDTGAIDIVLDPTNPDRVYAATWTRARRAWDFREGGAGSGLWGSTDGGQTWARLNVEGSGFPTGADVGRIGLDAHPSGALFAVVDNQARRPEEEPDEDAPAVTRDLLRAISTEDFLALAEDDLNAFLDANNVPYSYTAESILEMVRAGRIEPADLVGFLEDANAQLFDTPVVGAEVYRSDDHGRTWTRTHEGFLDDLFYSYGYYFGVLRVAPDDPDRLYVLGVPLVASSDGGATWARADAPQVHVDHHALWFDRTRPGYMISGNDGGLNVSYDRGATWSKLNAPAVGQFYAVQVDDAEPYNVYGGLQDNGVWVGPSTYEASRGWLAEGEYPYHRIMGGDGMQIQVDDRDGTVYTGFQFGNYFRTDRSGEGEAERVVPQHELGERPLRFNWQAPIWLSRHVPDVLYFGSNKVHRSLDRGDTWEALSDDLTGGGTPGDVPFGTLSSLHESPLEFGLLAAGTDDGHVWVSEDGGRTWQDRSAGLSPDLWVSRVELSGHDRGRLLVALNGYRWDHFESYVYASDDLGRTWQRVGLDLPAEPVNVATEDPRNPDVVYVGTDGGLYLSLDRGASFQAFHGQRARPAPGDGDRGPFMGPDSGADSPALPYAPVHDLVVQEREADLVVGTHGRSIWIVDVGLVQQMTPAVQSSALHVFAPDTLTHNESWGSRGYTWSDPREPSVQIGYTTTVTGTARVRVLDAEGGVVRQMDDAAEPGINLLAYDLRADRALGDDHEPGEDTGAFTLIPGEYVVEVTLAGRTETAPLVVEAGPEPRSRARKKAP